MKKYYIFNLKHSCLIGNINSISIVIFCIYYTFAENFGGNVGLAISQAINLTGMFQWGMRQSAELENQMTSVERVLEYSDVEMEPPLESPPGKYYYIIVTLSLLIINNFINANNNILILIIFVDKKPRASWPEKGRIEFIDVHLRYSATEPWVLRNLNFVILPQQKVN